MRERVLDGDAAELGAGPAAERAAARGQHEPRDLARVAAAQRLVERGVLGVDRHDLAAAALRAAWTTGPPAIRLSLFASASRLPASSAAIVAGKAGEADDRVEHDVGVGSAASSASASGSSSPERARFGRDAELGRLRGEQLGVAAGGERDDLASRRRDGAVPADDVERLGPDRAGRPQDGDARHRRQRGTRHQVKTVQREVVGRRQGEEDRVEAVEEPAVAGQERAEVLEAEVALHHRLGEVAERSGDRHDERRARAPAPIPSSAHRCTTLPTMPPRTIAATIAGDEPLDRLVRRHCGAAAASCPIAEPTK